MFERLKAEIRHYWRNRADEVDKAAGIAGHAPVHAPDDERLDPPDADRVARRALALSAVALRGLMTTWPADEEAGLYPRFQQWLREAAYPAGLEDELEASEAVVIHTGPGELQGQAAINAVWRWEGAAVLASSLGRFVLPPYDEPCDPKACGDATGLFRRDVADYLASAAVAPAFDRETFACHVLAVHWRLRDFRLRPRAMDFATFAAGVQWAKFNLDGARLIENDLAIGDATISKADPERFQLAASITQERHVAANWLMGWSPIYSDVDTPT